jgi:hypothetical protein
MRKNRKKMALSRETLRSLSSPMLGNVVGASRVPCEGTVTCATNCAGYTCLPCTNDGGSAGVYSGCCTFPSINLCSQVGSMAPCC